MTNWKWVRFRKNLEDGMPAMAIMLVFLLIIALFTSIYYGQVEKETRIARLEEKLNTIQAMARHEQTVNPWVIIEIIEGDKENG